MEFERGHRFRSQPIQAIILSCRRDVVIARVLVVHSAAVLRSAIQARQTLNYSISKKDNFHHKKKYDLLRSFTSNFSILV